MTEHWIVVTAVSGTGEVEECHVECSDRAACEGWIGCEEPHSSGGYHDNNLGPWECDARAPWAEWEEWEFHGEHHEWKWGWGWTVAFPGCPVEDNYDNGWPGPREGNELGRYPVDEDWYDDTSVDLILID